MSIYGGLKQNMNMEASAELSVIESYIENNFLENCLNESVMSILDKISSISEAESKFDFAKSIIEEAESLSESAKCIIMKSLLEAMTEENRSVEESVGLLNESYDPEALLEFSGDPKKNEEFIECLKDLDQLCTFNMDKIRKLADYLGKLSDLADQIMKSPKKYKELLDKARGYVTEFNDWYNKTGKNISGMVTWNQFKQKVKKFNNKYSEITMEEKKKFNEKIVKYYGEISKLATPWAKNGKEIVKLHDKFDKLVELDRSYTQTFAKICDDCAGVLIEEANYTIGDVNYIIKALDVGKEQSLLYKVVNKVFK